MPGGNGIRKTPSWSVVTLATVAPDRGSTTVIREGHGLSPHLLPTALTGQPPSMTLTPVTPDPLGGLGGTGTGAGESGRSAPVGEVDWDRTNVMGGSIAVGHPFGATGARLATTLANEMARRGVQFGLVSICAQGGMGLAMVLENLG